MFTKKNFPKLILSFVVLLTLILGIIIWIYPPALFPDPSWGLQVLRGMQKGGGFNMLPNPDMDDISKNSTAFLSWWSPGQYLVPYFFITVFKLGIARAVALTITVCTLTGLAGFYALFKKTGFSPIITAVSIAFIACQQAYVIPYSFYNGGETLLFAFVGWFLYGCVHFKKTGILQVVFILLSGIIGFFCKSSFLWIYFSGLTFLWVSLSSGKKLAAWILNGLTIGLPAILSLATIYAGYLSKGGNPASAGMSLKLSWETFSFPLASPLLAGFSIDDITNGIINKPIIFLILLALLSIVMIIYVCRTIPYKNFTLLLTVVYIVSVLFFGINFLRQANISYESRHMRIVGLLVTPAIIYIVSKVKFPYKVFSGLIWLFITYTGIHLVTEGYKRDKYNSSHGKSGLSQIYADQPTLNYIMNLDEYERNAIFVFISPDLGIEILHNSIITFDPLDENMQAENQPDIYRGHRGPLHILLPKSYTAAMANIYIKCFPGYKSFIMVKPGKDYIIYTAQ